VLISIYRFDLVETRKNVTHVFFFWLKRGSFDLYLARDSGVNHVQDAKFHISTLQRITGLVAGKHALFF